MLERFSLFVSVDFLKNRVVNKCPIHFGLLKHKRTSKCKYAYVAPSPLQKKGVCLRTQYVLP